MMLQLSRNKVLEEESWCRLVSNMHIAMGSTGVEHAHFHLIIRAVGSAMRCAPYGY